MQNPSPTRSSTSRRALRFWCRCGSLLLLAVSTPATAAAEDGLTRIRDKGVLVWGADQEGGGPFVFNDRNDPEKLVGLDVDLAELIARRLGVKARFAQGPWDRLPELVDRGDIDLVLNGYEWTKVRSERYGTTIPYYVYELQLLARANDSEIHAWDDLLKPGRRPRVAALGASAAQDYLAALASMHSLDIVSFDGVTDAMRAVELGTDGIDANLQDLPIWIFYRDGFPRLKPVGPPVGRGYYVGIVRKQDRALLQEINAAILDALGNGELRKILQKYGLWNTTQAQRALETDNQGNFLGGTVPSDMNMSFETRPAPLIRDPETAAIGPGGTHSASNSPLYESERGWRVLRRRGWLLIAAAGMTALLAFTSMPLAILAGLGLALARLYGPRVGRWLATAWVETIRGTPLVLQLYVIFFLLPEIGWSLPAFWAAVMGLALNYSAYEAEIYRAGLQAIPTGQMEAALALGMSRGTALRRVIIPQATRIVIPPVTNDFIALFKDTAVCSVITVVELSKQYYVQARSTGAIVELGILTGVLYLAMSYPLSLLAMRLEARLAGTDRP